MQGGVAADLILIRKAGGSQGVARCGFILFGQPTSIGAHNRAKLTAKIPQRGSAFAAAAHQVGRQCCAGPPPVRKIKSKGLPFSMRGVRAIAANPRDGSSYSSFWFKPHTLTPKSAQLASRAPARAELAIWADLVVAGGGFLAGCSMSGGRCGSNV